METHAGINAYYAQDRKRWRDWLKKNGDPEKSVWLILYRKQTGKRSIAYAEAVEEALCFGWIDSKANKRDENSYYLFFAKRNPKSNWSKSNKQRIEKLIEEGLMTEKGMAAIAIAKKNGTWSSLDKIEKLQLPADLKKALKTNQAAGKHFQKFPPSVKKQILGWIENAKRNETRAKRILETVTLAQKNIRANQSNAKV